MGKVKTNRIIPCALVLAGLWSGSAIADAVTVSWPELRASRPASCSGFLKHYKTQANCSQQAASARLLSKRYEKCAPGSPNLDGKTVRIAGYVHPLEFEFKDVKEFLLIPPLRQDCRHPPPPLPDQVISVTFPEGITVTADPVWATGILRLQQSKTHLATASYTLEAVAITPATIPDAAANSVR